MKNNRSISRYLGIPLITTAGFKFKTNKNRKGLLTTFLLILCFVNTSNAQDNLLTPDIWPVGTGSTNGYSIYGPSNENERIQGVDPFGESAVLWASKPDGSAGPDGGFFSPTISLDLTKTYRFTVWIKKIGSNSGNSYLGLYTRNSSNSTVTQRLDGSVNTNPYFWFGDVPELNKWYLLVGYLRPNSYTGASEGKMYDGETKQEVTGVNFNDYKFGIGATTMRLRSLLFNDSSNTDFQHYWKPTIYELNTSTPTIDELLGVTTNDSNTSGEGFWASQDDDISYASGNVGIGTNPLADYVLAVEGNIRAREVKVDNDSWPDYVFDTDYELPTLQEVENHIQEKGHLINIPSATEVETNGLLLGRMNGLLLEKIEEITLYLLDHEERIKSLEEREQY